MRNEFEYLKSLNLVELLSSHYQLQFRAQGNAYVCLSPFTDETNPSFYVKQGEDGHWLFKDFSSGYGGSIIDFVLLKEHFHEVAEAVGYLRKRINQIPSSTSVMPLPSANIQPGASYDIDRLYQQLKSNSIDLCRDYLLSRGISDELILQLENQGVLLHNNYKAVSYCSFAVYDGNRRLHCIDNHQIGGSQKFVLGQKYPFSLDWSDLNGSKPVHICESIIDYLSLKTLEGCQSVGLALLGNQFKSYDLSVLQQVPILVSCFDNDVGGFRGYLDLVEQFQGKQIDIYELQPGQKDVNERLLSERYAQRAAQLTVNDKLAIYKAFIVSDNRSQLAKDWGIDRSYLYKIVNECEAMLVNNFQDRHPGRKSSTEMKSTAEAKQRILELEQENQKLIKEKELYYARSEFLKLRLKWSEHEVSELQGTAQQSPPVKKQIKKKKRKKR